MKKSKKIHEEVKNQTAVDVSEGVPEELAEDLIDAAPDKILETDEKLKKEYEDMVNDLQTLKNENILKETKESEELRIFKEQLVKKENELKEYIELSQRVKAEFDNYRKRAAKEKEQLYSDITGEIITKFLPIVDNLERALVSVCDSSDLSKLTEGIDMTLRQFKDVLTKEGVEEIDSLNQEFNPNFHNAVMHIEDESSSDNTVVEVFQKGYKIKDRVLRHSMVKVSN